MIIKIIIIVMNDGWLEGEYAGASLPCFPKHFIPT